MEIIIAVSVYLGLLMLLGGLQRRSAGSFLLANRRLGSWAVVWSLLATSLGGGILLAAGAYIYEFGVSALWFFVGKIIGLSVLGYFMHTQRQRSHAKAYLNLPDYFADYHSLGVARVVALALLYGMLGALLMNAVGGAKMISFVSGWSYEVSLTLFLGLVLLYTYLGGFTNIVRTDKVQAWLFMLVFLVFLLPLGQHWEAIEPSQWAWDGIGYGTMAAFLVAGLLLPFTQSEMWQRFYACDAKTAYGSTLLIFLTLYLVFGVLLCLVLMLIRAQLPGLDPDLAILQGVVQLFPPVLVSLGVVAFLAMIMSTIDSLLFAFNTMAVQEVFNPARNKTPEQLQGVLRWSLVLVTLLVLAVAWLWRSVVEIGIYFTALVLSVACVVLLSWLNRQKVAPLTLIGGVVGGFLGFHLSLLWQPLTPDLVLNLLVSVFGGVLFGSTINAVREYVADKRR